jgi:hypothetical protein
MKTSILVLCLATTTLSGCQNPVRDPIDLVVQVGTDPQREIQKGRRQYPFALPQSGGDLTEFPLTTNYLNSLIQRFGKSSQLAISMGNSIN